MVTVWVRRQRIAARITVGSTMAIVMPNATNADTTMEPVTTAVRPTTNKQAGPARDGALR